MSSQYYVVAQRSRLFYGYCYFADKLNSRSSNWTKNLKEALWYGSIELAKEKLKDLKFNKPAIFRFNYVEQQDRIKPRSVCKVF